MGRLRWHDRCAILGVVTDLRLKVAALSLVAAFVAMTGGPLFAQAMHPVCVAKQHDCGDQDPTPTESTPGQPRVEVRADISATPAILKLIPTPARQALTRVQTSPPRLCLLDLPTLFATFLI
jgi:hypothetical protein